MVHKSDQRLNGVVDVSKATGLGAVAVNSDRLTLQRLTNKGRDHHAIALCLAGTRRVEEASNHDRQSLFLPVRQGQELVHGFRTGVAPSRFACWSQNQVVRL